MSERRVLVVAPNWLGDAVMALAALSDVRRAYSLARLTVAARAPVAALYSMVPGVDETLVLEWRGSLIDRRSFLGDRARLVREKPDTAILFPNSFASAWTVHQAGVMNRWAYSSDLRRPLLTRPIARPRGSMHQGAYYQRLVRELGMPNGDLEPAVVVPPAAIEQARELLTASGWNGSRRLLAIAPGAAYGTAKRWLPRHFGALIARAAADLDVQCVLVGSGGDQETARWVLDETEPDTRNATIDLTGKTTLQTLAGVMRLAAACVSNDSGAMHLAGAVGTPLAALFGPTRDRETAPLCRHDSRAEVLFHPVWCRPCMLRECPIDHRCMKGLAPGRVFETVRSLLGYST